MASDKSIEEIIEDIAKTQLNKGEVKYYVKNSRDIGEEISEALEKAPSKKGGSGGNYPDIKTLIRTKDNRELPVMIEVKGKKGQLKKVDENDQLCNRKKNGEPHFQNIDKYAVNGAVHYASSILKYSNSYDDVVAVGVNGFKDNGDVIQEIEAWCVSKNNMGFPKKIGEFNDLSFLYQNNIEHFISSIEELSLTEDEKEFLQKEYEEKIEKVLKSLNQKMEDELKISVGSRVELVAGLIMAGLGVEGKVRPLSISDLKCELGSKSHDGCVVINKISSFLEEKPLPKEKKEMIINDLSRVFIFSDLWRPVEGVAANESKLKSVYTVVRNEIIPLFKSSKHLDFTGKLFNVLNDWVDIPDSAKNDVVLTPRYVTDFMARLCEVNKDSYVWDYAVGSAGFLISSMKFMIEDASKRIKSPKLLNKKISDIKRNQLLGVEKRADIYLLAVLNMILMGDGSSNIIHKDSLSEYKGIYEQGNLKDKSFPADVFLLNPPYSAPGKGFVFVDKALKKMKKGKACVLIQENAGAEKGLPYTKSILENNTLRASIHMPTDLFMGKSGVQTAIYVFEIGRKHNVKDIVRFLDFSNDGYTRRARKKSSQNLKNTDNAVERYNEAVDLVLFGKNYLKYFTDKEFIEDTITLEGNDWTFFQHKKYDTIPKEEDFFNVIGDYVVWRLQSGIKEKQLSKKA